MKAYRPLGRGLARSPALPKPYRLPQHQSAGFGGDRSLRASPRVELKRAIPGESGIGAEKQGFVRHNTYRVSQN